MASKTLIELIDDLDGSPAAETVTFAIDGVTYEIDLSDANAAQLRGDISRWTEHGRRVGGRRARTAKTTTSGTATASSRKRDLGVVREWAKANGHKVSDRGRVPQPILDAYDAAH
ncbi:MAG TPA: Lsr2 family protein, partial [Actinotalea caeni]|uniref:histone-like nucleoid-structuring protein Lsr2 n=1 Tax=Actinotalea caeni TaxID=1348467 RepID=UPI002B4ABA64